MVNIMICCVYSSMADSLLNPITCSWVIMLIEVNSHWKQFASCWPTRSSILKISSSFAVTMNVQVSIVSMGSMMSVSNTLFLYQMVPRTAISRDSLENSSWRFDSLSCYWVTVNCTWLSFTLHGRSNWLALAILRVASHIAECGHVSRFWLLLWVRGSNWSSSHSLVSAVCVNARPDFPELSFLSHARVSLLFN